MNKEETIKDIQDIINANSGTISEQSAKSIAEALYNANYRKLEEKDEHAIWAMNGFVDLLDEFDEMGYAPTTLCENPEEEAKEWKNKALAKFEIMLSRTEILTALYNEWRDDEIELDWNRERNRLWGYIEEAVNESKKYIAKNIALGAENAELSKKLRQGLLNIDTVKEMDDMRNIDKQRKQAVHNFAYHILSSLQCRIDDAYDEPDYKSIYEDMKQYIEQELEDFDNE